MKKMYIEMDNLKVDAMELEGEFEVTSCNNGGLYFLEGYDCDGNKAKHTLTRRELAKLVDIYKVDETLEYIRHKDFENNWTDDGLNFISEDVLNKLDNKTDYEQVEWIPRFSL